MSGWERHLARVVNGTYQLGTRRWRWLWETKAGRTIIRRLLITAGAGWAMYRLAGQWPWLWAVAIALVLTVGYRAAEEDQPVETDDEPEPLDPALTRAALRTELIDTVLRLADGYANVHLSKVHADWLDQGLIDPDRTLSEFRRFAEGLGVPVRDSVKASGSTAIGVRVADLPAAGPQPVAEATPPVVPDDLLQDWSSSQVSLGTTPVDYRPDYPKDYPC